jgi:hypothetical protein
MAARTSSAIRTAIRLAGCVLMLALLAETGWNGVLADAVDADSDSVMVNVVTNGTPTATPPGETVTPTVPTTGLVKSLPETGYASSARPTEGLPLLLAIGAMLFAIGGIRFSTRHRRS